MNLTSGYPFWLIKHGLPFDYPKLDRNIQTEIAIIGGGISGALVAYHLIGAGIECVTVDARTIGLGSTCASTSLLQYEIDTPLFRLKEMVGEKHANRAYELCGEAIHKLSDIARQIGLTTFRHRPSLYYAAAPSHTDFLQKEFLARKNAGFNVQLLGPEEIRKMFGFDAPAAILSDIAAEADAYLMTHLLHQYNLKKGAKVFDRTPIENVDDDGSGVILHTKKGFQIKARKVVYASGYEVTEMLQKNIVKLHSTYACASEQYGADREFWSDNAIIWNTAQPYLYMRTTADGRILMGGNDDRYDNPNRRDRLIPKKTEQLVRDFNAIFPSLEFVPEYSWAGTFGSTKDGLPYIGVYHRYPNRYFSLGFGGNGITFSLVGAEMIRDMYLGKTNPDASIFSFDR